jgi:hypothetical protein
MNQQLTIEIYNSCTNRYVQKKVPIPWKTHFCKLAPSSLLSWD